MKQMTSLFSHKNSLHIHNEKQYDRHLSDDISSPVQCLLCCAVCGGRSWATLGWRAAPRCRTSFQKLYFSEHWLLQCFQFKLWGSECDRMMSEWVMSGDIWERECVVMWWCDAVMSGEWWVVSGDEWGGVMMDERWEWRSDETARTDERTNGRTDGLVDHGGHELRLLRLPEGTVDSGQWPENDFFCRKQKNASYIFLHWIILLWIDIFPLLNYHSC
jgi:hypothetical protein